MRAAWDITEEDLHRWAEFVKCNENKPLPRKRYLRNVKRVDIDLSQRAIWKAIVGCQVTTQQRSGPDSNVSKFLDSDSSVLDPSACRKSKNLRRLIADECTKAGLRRGNNVSDYLGRIFDYLESGGWRELVAQLETLSSHTTLKKERAVVSYILDEKKFPGLGQKQARNLIQWLGLSRYEIPIDSRVLKCMKQMGANLVPKPAALTDESVYLFVQDALQEVARKIQIYPCQLDACIFASFDIDKDEEVGE